MNCCEFRENYSDFADGLLDEAAEIDARHHLAECAACHRFDAAFRTGVGMLREIPGVTPSRCFAENLIRKIRHEALSATPALRRWSGAAGAMLIVTVIGIIGWDYRGRGEEGTRPAAPGWRFPDGAPIWGIRSNSALRFAPDSAFYAGHPFRPVPLPTDTPSARYADQLRFESRAVWAGR